MMSPISITNVLMGENMKRILVCIFVFLVTATSIYADEEVVDGVSWGYSLKNGTVTIERRYDSKETLSYRTRLKDIR